MERRGGSWREERGTLNLEMAPVAHSLAAVLEEAGGGQMWGGQGSPLTAAAARLGGRGIPKGRAFSVAAWARARFQGLIHLLTDDVHKALKHLLHIDILLGAGLKELKTWMDRRWGQLRQSCESQGAGLAPTCILSSFLTDPLCVWKWCTCVCRSAHVCLDVFLSCRHHSF